MSSFNAPTAADATLAGLEKTHPHCVQALVLYGQILAMKGQPAEAEQRLSRACELAPDSAEARFQLGVFYDGRQQNAKAAEQFTKVIALTPQDPRAYDYLALRLEPLGRIEEAEQAYRKGLAVNRRPNFDAFLDYNYGRFLLKQNRLTELKRHLDRAVELAPKTRAVYYERARLNLKLRNNERARSDAERALTLQDPGGVILDLQVYYLPGACLLPAGGERVGREVRQIEPNEFRPLEGQTTQRTLGGYPAGCRDRAATPARHRSDAKRCASAPAVSNPLTTPNRWRYNHRERHGPLAAAPSRSSRRTRHDRAGSQRPK